MVFCVIHFFPKLRRDFNEVLTRFYQTPILSIQNSLQIYDFSLTYTRESTYKYALFHKMIDKFLKMINEFPFMAVERVFLRFPWCV